MVFNSEVQCHFNEKSKQTSGASKCQTQTIQSASPLKDTVELNYSRDPERETATWRRRRQTHILMKFAALKADLFELECTEVVGLSKGQAKALKHPSAKDDVSGMNSPTAAVSNVEFSISKRTSPWTPLKITSYLKNKAL